MKKHCGYLVRLWQQHSKKGYDNSWNCRIFYIGQAKNEKILQLTLIMVIE